VPRDDEKMLRLLARGVCRLGAATQERNPTTNSNTKTRCPSLTICGMLGRACAPPDLRPRSVGLRCRSTRPTTTTTLCRVALPLHPTYDYDHALSGCAAAPPDLLLARGVCRLGAAAQERNPTAAPPDLRLCSVGLRCRSTGPTTEAICLIAGREIASCLAMTKKCCGCLRAKFVGWMQQRRSETQPQQSGNLRQPADCAGSGGGLKARRGTARAGGNARARCASPGDYPTGPFPPGWQSCPRRAR